MLLDATNKDNLATFETIQWSTRSLTIHHTIKSLWYWYITITIERKWTWFVNYITQCLLNSASPSTYIS